MADYREFLRVLAHRQPGRAVGFEYTWDKSLAEQLIWRRGDTLWQDTEALARTRIDTASRCGLDTVVLDFLQLPASLPRLMPEGLRAVALLSVDSNDCQTAAETEGICAVMLRGYGKIISDRAEFLRSFRPAVDAIRKAGKPVIWADCGKEPLPVSWAADCGFDAIHLTHHYASNTAEIWQEFHRDLAILGDTRMDWLIRQKPRDILDYCESLQKLTQNCGFAFGMGNPEGLPVPYLCYVSVLTALARGK